MRGDLWIGHATLTRQHNAQPNNRLVAAARSRVPAEERAAAWQALEGKAVGPELLALLPECAPPSLAGE